MYTISYQKNNRVNVYKNGSFDIVTSSVSFYKCRPTVDSLNYSSVKIFTKGSPNQITLTYIFNDWNLKVEFIGDKSGLMISSQINIKNTDSISSVNLFSGAFIVDYDKILSHGYFSWDQSCFKSKYDVNELKSHGVAALTSNEQSVVFGFLQHDKFFQYFTFTSLKGETRVDSDIVLEGLQLSGRKTIQLSDLYLFSHNDVFKGQKLWAEKVAAVNNVELTKPPIRGWCSWYYDYFWFSGNDIENYMTQFKPYKNEMNLDVFVMDANYFSHLGDWLETNEKFPEGLKYYAELIRDNGYTPGIWIGPWMVGDRSKLFKEHSDWLCRDEEGELIEFMNPLGEDNVWGFRDKIHYCLDTSHPEAFNYLKKVFRTLYSFGFRYFKTDFMYWGSMDRFEGGWFHEGINAHNFINEVEDQPVIKRFQPGKTRVQYFVDVIRMIRKEVKDSIILGCGQPILMSLGKVDCMRISRDVGARWVAHNSPKELLNDLQLRNFMNNVFFQVDPDCALLRDFETKLTEDEVTSLALYMGVSQGMIMTSDPIHKCRKNRIDLFKFIQADNEKIDFRPPLLGKENDLIVYVGYRNDSDLRVLFCFNSSEEEVSKEFRFDTLELPEKNYCFEWKKEKNVKTLKNKISVKLKPHQSRLFFLKKSKFKKGYKPERISG